MNAISPIADRETWNAQVDLPESVSASLPSRGMVMTEGTIAARPFRAAVEPNDKGAHWFQVDQAILDHTGVKAGDTVEIELIPSKEWSEPEVPSDLLAVLDGDEAAHAIWRDIAVMARWDWIRWIGATKVAETRKKRVESIPSRMAAGKRRPCCFAARSAP